jgi:hypothetical protein
MKKLLICLLLLAPLAKSQTASEMKNGGEQKRPGETEEQKGKRLLDQMVQALGGDAWRNKRTMYREGQTAAFFSGQPTGSVVRFVEYTKFAEGKTPQLQRIEFLTVRGMIVPGMKRDVVHIWDPTQGYEVTYKGQTVLPEKQVIDYMRRRDHSIEEVMRTWVKQPGVTILAEGSGMRDRRPVDKVTILSATSNDAVTIELDQETHLPLQRSFEWRNEQFKDKDIDEEVYGDWRQFDGVMTPMNQTNYRNGDMAAQVFYTKVSFNQPIADELFDHTKLLKK